MAKTVYIKIYNQAGVFQGFYADYIFDGFKKSINSGLGDLSINLPRKFDNFGEGAETTLGNELQVWIKDQEAPSGRLIYSGEINSIEPSLSSQEQVQIACSGYISQLAMDILTSGTTIYQKYTQTELKTIIEDVIDKYRIVNTSAKINYSATSIGTTGKTETVEFYLTSPMDAILTVKDLANYNWYFYIDENNILNFRAFSTTPDHYFVVGKDVVGIDISKNIRDTRNALLFSNGLTQDDPEVILKLYSDTTSVASYGRRVELKRDGRFKASTGSVDELGANFIATYKDPINTVQLKIVDSNLAGGYDIESVQPGDTCKINNISTNSALTGNMLITGVEYHLDYIIVDLVDTQKYTDRLIAENRKTIQDYAFDDNLPQTYTT